MKTWIALLRGINVGGNNILPMKDLRAIAEGLGFENVRTYIQSGNCIFQTGETEPERLAKNLSDAIERHAGFYPSVCVLASEKLENAIDAVPFEVEAENHKNVHLFFLFEKPAGFDALGLHAFATQQEEFLLIDKTFYLHTPNGIGRSKLAEKLSKFLAVEMTARNLRSATKIAELASDG